MKEKKFRSMFKDRLVGYQERLELWIDAQLTEKLKEKDVPSIAEFEALKKRIQELEEEKERVKEKRRRVERRNIPPQVPDINFEHASCSMCARPQYRAKLCLYHFEKHFLGE